MTPFRKYQKLADFFSNYAYVFNRGISAPEAWTEETAEHFAACFIAAGPTGTVCGQNSEQFREAIEKGYHYYQSIGIKSMKIDSQEDTFLDEHSSMAKVNWTAAYKTQNGTGKIKFTVIYLVHLLAGEYKIFAYITGDEGKALKEAKLI
jgi:hypothetical protein